MCKNLAAADANNTETWTQYRSGLCDGCRANCCQMMVRATLEDMIRMGLIAPLDAVGSLKKIARELEQDGIIEHYSPAQSLFTLARQANSDCVFLDAQTRRCTIYDVRPAVCRRYPQVGPKPGYCPYEAQ